MKALSALCTLVVLVIVFASTSAIASSYRVAYMPKLDLTVARGLPPDGGTEDICMEVVRRARIVSFAATRRHGCFVRVMSGEHAVELESQEPLICSTLLSAGEHAREVTIDKRCDSPNIDSVSMQFDAIGGPSEDLPDEGAPDDGADDSNGGSWPDEGGAKDDAPSEGVPVLPPKP